MCSRLRVEVDPWLAHPIAQLGELGDELRYGLRRVEGDASLVERRGDAGCFQQSPGGRRVPDELAVGEGVGDEVAAGRIGCQQATPLRGQDRNGVKRTEGPPSIFCRRRRRYRR